MDWVAPNKLVQLGEVGKWPCHVHLGICLCSQLSHTFETGTMGSGPKILASAININVTLMQYIGNASNEHGCTADLL